MLKKKYYTGLQIHEAIDGVVGDYKKAIEIYRRLAKMETDDLVPVVRCKDCKYWDKTWRNDWSPDYHYCPMTDGVRKGIFYCAYAERSEDEEA